MPLLDLQALEADDGAVDRGAPDGSTLSVQFCGSELSVTLCQ